MSGNLCIVAADVGNSAVKLAVRYDPSIGSESTGGHSNDGQSNSDQSIRDHSICIGSTGWELSAIGWVRDQLGCHDTEWRIASVHRSAAVQLENAIRKPHQGVTIRLVSRHDVPMRVDVDHPDRLGIDRLLSAFGACNRIKPPTVVIDAGSAVTVDWVDRQGRFCGGAILPGLGLQSQSLVMGTEALPHVQWDSDAPIRLPAKNTADAIRGGIVAGVSSSIDGLIERYRKAASVELDAFRVVLTGGDASILSPHLRHTHQVVPNLVCRGLLDLPRSLEANTNTSEELG